MVIENLTEKEIQDLLELIGEENARKIIKGAAKFQIIEEQFLTSLGTTFLDPIKVKKDKFFVTGENGTTKLWISDNFQNIFLPLVAGTIDYKGGKLEKLKLSKRLNVFQIKEERGEILIQSPTDIAGEIASLTSNQPKGEEGGLLVNRHGNLFYFEKDAHLFDVYVGWDAGRRRWDCGCGRADSVGWDPGNQVLSPATQDL